MKNIEIQSLLPSPCWRFFREMRLAHLISLELLYTPTTFKRQGQFVLFPPDTRLIFQSLMQKYSLAGEGKAEIEEETLEFLAGY